MTIDPASALYLTTQRHGRLATVAPDGTLHNKPIGFTYNAELGTIDIAGFNMESSAKYRNVAVNPTVAFVVDDILGDREGAASTRFLEIRGQAEQVVLDQPAMAGLSPEIIRIHPTRVISWNVDPEQPGMHTYDIASLAVTEPVRPALGAQGKVANEAVAAVTGLVEELQAGLDQHDADLYNRHFAADVMWGSPFGATVDGYEQLHAIHLRLHRERRGGSSSRYEVVRVLAPAPDVAVAQVRRVGLDADGQTVEPTPDAIGAFSEMALYVFVRRGGTWWLAAGQNTPIRPGGAPIPQ